MLKRKYPGEGLRVAPTRMAAQVVLSQPSEHLGGGPVKTNISPAYLAIALCLGSGCLPAVKAESATPSIRFTGAPTDGGQNCSACHTQSGAPQGSVTLDVAEYTPGVTQSIQITITDPRASRAGFELTARSVSDETRSAGSFTAGPGVQVRCDDGSGSRTGSLPPCPSPPREFAEHLGALTAPRGSTFTFNVNWTAPSAEIGKIVFYLSAVAADGDSTAFGDTVYTISKTISFIGSCPIAGKLTATRALNGASFLPPFSSSSMMSIFGTNFTDGGTKRTAGRGDFVDNGFPTTLACIAVEMSQSGSTPVRVPVVYVQQDQINIQAPVFANTGPVSLVVIRNPGKPNETRSDVATLTALQSFAPAFFTFGTSNSIAALFANSANIVARPGVVPGASPAKPGDIIELFGTGFGDTNPSTPTGQLAPAGVSPLVNPITVSIGGIMLASGDVSYQGLSPGSIGGLYQFNVRIPASAPSGDLPVVITIGGVQTQPGATIPVQAPM